jgi:hypothetical protein
MESFAYGQIIKVLHDDETYTYYVQTSKDADNPDWENWGSILSKVFDNQIEEDEFLFTALNKINEPIKTEKQKIIPIK